jgi:hypothetical protein
MKAFGFRDFNAGDHRGDQMAFARSEAEPADYTNREGASVLKARIEAYWRERGQEVQLSLHDVGFHPAIRAARFDVRSNMINGMPRGALAAAAANDRQEFTAPAAEADADLDVDDVWID